MGYTWAWPSACDPDRHHRHPARVRWQATTQLEVDFAQHTSLVAEHSRERLHCIPSHRWSVAAQVGMVCAAKAPVVRPEGF